MGKPAPADGAYLETELKRLIAEDPRVFEFLDAGSLDGVWYRDLTRPDCEWSSPRFWQVLGYDPAVMARRADARRSIVDPDDLARARDNFEKHLADPSHPYDQQARYRHADGSTVTVRCRGMAIRDADGTPIRMLGVHNDVTALVRQRDEAQAASAMKSAFVANLSHEIRTPLNVVLGASELLGAELVGGAQRELIASIETAGRQLLSLVDDVMDLSRIEAGQIALAQDVFEPRTILHDLGRMFVYGVDDAGMELGFSIGPRLDLPICASQRHIRQVAVNLVGNALKHAGGTRVEAKMRLSPAHPPIATDPDRRPRHTLIIKVVDDGVGVADAHKARIFGRFVKGGVETAMREAGADWESPHGVAGPASRGSGLGLTIARLICAAHGGELRVSDTPGGGATFTAAFEVRAAEQDVAPRPAPSGADMLRGLTRPLRVLVAEDSEMNAEIMRRALALAPTQVDFVADGQDALARLQDTGYDAALLDIRMPRMSGLEVLERFEALRRDDDRPRPIFVACTAQVMPSQREVYAAAGFDLQVAKPYRLLDIAAALVDVCARLEGPGGR